MIKKGKAYSVDEFCLYAGISKTTLSAALGIKSTTQLQRYRDQRYTIKYQNETLELSSKRIIEEKVVRSVNFKL